ncbi:MAG: VCBS repeat-containing protein, partial [Mycobacteriaceae bacterium]|nr:VCBS repeat-containing protein [Mycobacteriaceae bacterium]
MANGSSGGSGYSVSVLRGVRVAGACSGQLGAPAHVQVAASPNDVRLADLNTDGCPDIVVSTSFNLYRFLNQTSGATCTGTFGAAAAQSLAAGRALELRDLNGDGCTDAVVGNWLNWAWPSYVSVLRGEKVSGACTGSFTPRTDVNTSATVNAGRGSQNLTIGDMNADTCPDIVSADRRGFDSFSVMLQTKTGSSCMGTFSTGIVYHGNVGCGAEGVAIGDFNEDGFADIVGLVTEGSPCPIEIMLGANGVNGAVGTLRDGNDATTYATVDNSNPGRVRTADFNQDGHLDVAVAPCCVVGLSVFPGLGDGTLASRIDFDPAVPGALQSPGLLITDIDADGAPDILTTVSGGGANKVVVFINSYSPPAQAPGADPAPSASTGSSSVAGTSSAREEAAQGVVRPASRLNQVSVLRERRRGAPVMRLRDAFTLARPGRYTVIYVRRDGMRATVRTNTVIGSRT